MGLGGATQETGAGRGAGQSFLLTLACAAPPGGARLAACHTLALSWNKQICRAPLREPTEAALSRGGILVWAGQASELEDCFLFHFPGPL